MKSPVLRALSITLGIMTLSIVTFMVPLSGRASVAYASVASSFQPVTRLTNLSNRLEHQSIDTPSQLGPWNGTIYFPGSTPVGGWYSLVLYSNGYYSFKGNFHVSGAPSYDTTIACVVKSSSGNSYAFTHTGRVHGTFESGSRDDPWNDSTTRDGLANDWAGINGGSYSCNYGVNVSLDSIINTVKTAVGIIGAIGSFL